MLSRKLVQGAAAACAGVSLAAACLAAAPAYGADAAAAEGPAASSVAACPQSPPPYMVGDPASGGSPVPGTTDARALPPGASPETTCVPPTLNYFDASPNPVDYGGSVTLSWSVSSPNPLSCNVSSSLGGLTGGAGGSWTAGPVTASTYFELYCWDAYGDGNTWGVTVGVNGGGGGSSSSVPGGWLDSVSGGGWLSGWSCDGDSYGTSIYVHVYADGAFVAQVPANGDRPDVAAATWACNGTGNHGYTYQLPNYLLNGQPHTIQVYGINVDGAGQVVGTGNTELAGSPKTVTLSGGDRTPPTVSIAAPSDGTVVSSTVQLGATAGDNVGVAGVQFQLDGNNIGNELTAAPYSESWNPAGRAGGLHTLTARARDGAGNVATASVTIRLSDSVNDGIGDEESSGSLSTGNQRSLAGSGWCTGKDQRWGTASAPHIQYRNMFTTVLYWKASVSVDVCIDVKRHVVVAFGHQRVTPLYTLPLVWQYDNKPAWSFGPVSNSTSFSWAQVVDSFTGCPWGLPIGCNKVSFTTVFNVAGSGTYSYTVKFH